MSKITIDAKNRKLGRVASEAAHVLMGKNKVDFARHRIPVQTVEIINAGRADISDKKKETKIYQRYSGYPGGQKDEILARLIDKKGIPEAFRRAVRGMLPANKLRAKMLKQLIVIE
jgi:large subunit ribosomal protein L13